MKLDEKKRVSGKEITSNMLWRLGERFGAQGVHFIVSVVLTRILSPEDYGVVALAMTFTTILAVFRTSGLGTSLIQKDKVDELDYSTALIANVGIGVVLYVIVYFVAPYLAIFYHEPLVGPVMRVLSLTLVIGSLNSIQHARIARAMRFKMFFKATLTGTLVSAVVGILLAVYGCGVWAIVAQHLTNQVIDTVILGIMIGSKPSFHFSLRRLKPLYRFGWRAYGASLLETTYNQLRSLLIGRYYTGTDLAFYNRGRHIPALINTMTNSAIQSVMFPAYAKMADDRTKLKSMMRRALSLGCFIIFPSMMGLAMVAEELINVLYTAKWLHAVPYLRIACFVFALTPMHIVNLQSLLAIGRSDLRLRVELIKKGVAVTVMLICVHISLMATAWSAVPLAVLALVVNAWPVEREIRYSLWEQFRDALPAVVLSVVMGMLVWLVGKLPLRNIFRLLLQIPTGVIAYCLLAKLSRNKDYLFVRDYLFGLVRKFRKRKETAVLQTEEQESKDVMDQKDIRVVTREKCTGCGACKAICPKNAISFQPDEEGFPSPVIDDARCVHCGLCEKTCPALHIPETQPIREAYAAQLLDRKTLMESTSGGLFTAFSREVFRRGGVVYGCVWDEQYNAVIRKAENEEEMKPMRGSKYVWSWAGDTFSEIKNFLEIGRTVMFVGNPCQVAGLKNYLKKDYERLYLVDFFCGGAPSPRAFQSYLETITKDVTKDKLDFKLRDKSKYGVGVNISYNGKHGRVHQNYIRNPYFYTYHTKVLHRPPCYDCQFREEQRFEDLTFGDYWGIASYHKEFDTRAGVSALLVNSEKGRELLNAVRDELQLSPTKFEDIARGNCVNTKDKRRVYHVPEFRNAFFERMQKQGWKSAERKYLYSFQRVKLDVWRRMTPKMKRIVRKAAGILRHR